jgi:hypothetical protein
MPSSEGSMKDLKIQQTIKSGKVLYTFADKFNIYYFLLAKENNEDVMYEIITDKYFNITDYNIINMDIDFNEVDDIVFHKPIRDNAGGYKFIGRIAYLNDDVDSFSIDINLEVTIKEEEQSINKSGFEMLECLERIEVKRHIQRDSLLYLIGYEGDRSIPFYGIVDIENDLILKIYYLYSDIGDIEPLTICMDLEESRVHVCGGIYDEVKGGYIPFFESFLNIN